MKKLVLILLTSFSVFIPVFSQDECLIKGNINGKGEKIYHIPAPLLILVGICPDRSEIKKAGQGFVS